MKILIVDDELVSRKKMERIMENFGDVKSVNDGQSAINEFTYAWESWNPYDLITLDVSMPDMDGTDVLYKIRTIEKKKKLPANKTVKVLMVTSHADKDTVIQSINIGCNDYLIKPFSKKVILEKIRNLHIKYKQ